MTFTRLMKGLKKIENEFHETGSKYKKDKRFN